MTFPNNCFDIATDDIKAGEILLREEVFNMACFHFQLNAITLNQFYILTRYPDAPVGSLSSGIPSKDLAEEALKCAKEIFNFCIDAISRFEKKHIERRYDR